MVETKKIITVFGGKQKRPNVHIDDITDAYLFFLKKKIKFGVFNIGFENLSIAEIAKKIAKETNAKIKYKINTNDPRSYNLDSSKLLRLGFKPKKKILDAIQEFKIAYKNGQFKDRPNFHSVKWLTQKKK